MNKDLFNLKYSNKYGSIYTKNTTEEDKTLHDEIKWISEMLNNYYNNKKVSIMTPEGIKNEVWESTNSEKDDFHPYINVCCINSLTPNAFATKLDNEYYIGIFKGLLIYFKEHLKDFVEDEAFGEIPEIGMVVPYVIHQKLYENCIKFLSFHEFFHINNGHCDLSTSIGVTELCEMESGIKSNNNMIIQTLEYDADCCAIAALVNEELRFYQTTFINLGVGNFSCIINSLVQYLSSILISLYIFHNWINAAYYEGIDINKETLEDKTHPIPGLRIHYIILNMFSVLEKWKVFNEEEMRKIHERTINSFFTFVNKFRDVSNPLFLKSIIKKDGLDHIQKVHDNWKDVRKLLKNNYSNLAPYSEFKYRKIFSVEE